MKAVAVVMSLERCGRIVVQIELANTALYAIHVQLRRGTRGRNRIDRNAVDAWRNWGRGSNPMEQCWPATIISDQIGIEFVGKVIRPGLQKRERYPTECTFGEAS